MLNELFGIDYNKYVCGGVGNIKLFLEREETILFTSEEEMLHILGELKGDYTVDDIKVFKTNINRIEYKLQKEE